MKIGFIGQGWIGKHYADDFENRGYDVIRYALEAPYHANKSLILSCEIVFIAVPTPTTSEGVSLSAVRDALTCCALDTTVVIKSTLLPGTTSDLQDEFPNLYVLHSPEFLREATASFDASHPERNLIGIPQDTAEHYARATQVLEVVPRAPYQKIMPAKEAEFVKYAGNAFLYSKVVFMNTLYDIATKSGADYDIIRDALIHDPRIGESHTTPVHKSGHLATTNEQPKRGAGGHCFIKDFEAYRQFVATQGDAEIHDILQSLIAYNNRLLVTSQKDLDLLGTVYPELTHTTAVDTTPTNTTPVETVVKTQ